MNPIIDTIMLILFGLFIFYIIRGYHVSKMQERNENKKGDNNHDTLA